MQATLVFFVIIGLWWATVGQPTTSQSGSCDSCPDEYKASRERGKILETIDSLMSDMRQIESPRATLQACGLSWANMAQSDTRKYLVGPDELNWHEAREKCHQCGYALAKIETQQEMTFIKSWINNYASSTPRGTVFGQSIGRIWVDGTDEDHERCWVWTYPEISPMSPEPGFSFWAPGQPDHHRNVENCATIWGNYGWNGNDALCNMRAAYLCEKAPGELRELPTEDEVRGLNGTIPCA